MENPEIKLDRRFLKFLYQDKVNEINNAFEVFIEEIPRSLAELNALLNEKCLTKALDKINEAAPAFNAIGLPYLAIKLQTVGVYLDFFKVQDAKISMREFEYELQQYIPVILHEYSRLKAYHDCIRSEPAKALAQAFN